MCFAPNIFALASLIVLSFCCCCYIVIVMPYTFLYILFMIIAHLHHASIIQTCFFLFFFQSFPDLQKSTVKTLPLPKSTISISNINFYFYFHNLCICRIFKHQNKKLFIHHQQSQLCVYFQRTIRIHQRLHHFWLVDKNLKEIDDREVE